MIHSLQMRKQKQEITGAGKQSLLRGQPASRNANLPSSTFYCRGFTLTSRLLWTQTWLMNNGIVKCLEIQRRNPREFIPMWVQWQVYETEPSRGWIMASPCRRPWPAFLQAPDSCYSHSQHHEQDKPLLCLQGLSFDHLLLGPKVQNISSQWAFTPFSSAPIVCPWWGLFCRDRRCAD